MNQDKIKDYTQSELTLQQREAAMRLVVYIRECNDILLDTPLYLIYQRAFTFFGISLEADEIYRLKHKYDVDITLIDIINSIKSRKAKDFLLQTCYNLIKPTGDFELLGSLYEISKEIGYQKSEVTRLLFAKVNSDETLRKIAEIEDEVESKVNEILKNEKRQLGFCHKYWSTKKRILLEGYGIEWFTPAECNPDIMYD